MLLQRSRFLSLSLTLFVLSYGVANLKVMADEDGKKPSCHLFILSGQSNMAGLDPNLSFTPMVEEAFGKENVVVVKDALGGQPIRRWIPNWKDANGKSYPKTGDLYERLMKKVYSELGDRSTASVTFVWMQGERDAREKHGDVYGKSFKELVSQVTRDVKKESINVVIGRLSDFDMKDERYPHWTKVRKAQYEFAKKHKNATCIDTDKLNGEKDDLHYTKEGYVKLGALFAESAIKQIQKLK